MDIKTRIDLSLENEVRKLLRIGKKVDAVAAVQRKMKIGLKNSKDFVDRLEESLDSKKTTKIN